MEECIAAAGENGKYQKIITFIGISLGSLPFTLSITYAYLTKIPKFLCKDEFGLFTQECDFDKKLFCSNDFAFIKDKKNSVDNFTYKFDLYCSREFFITLYSTLFFFGGLIGSVLFASIPDKYGRKKIFQILQVGGLILQINILFAQGPWHLFFIYFFSGIATYSYGMSSIIIAEYLPRNISNIVMSIANGSFPLCGIIIGIFFCIFNNMKLLFIITCLIQFITTYLSLKYFKESPIWLFSLKLKEKFIQTMKEIAIINNRESQFLEWLNNNKANLDKLMAKNSNEKNNLNNNEKDEEDIKTYTLREIFGFNSQKYNLIKSFICWFMIGCVFYGIILNLAFFKGNFYIICFCSFFGEITGELSSGYLSGIFGRIKIIYINCFISGISLIIFTLADSILINYLCIYLATMGIASGFNILFIYTPELYPTPIRGTICGYTYLLSRFGAMVVSPITTNFGIFNTNILFAVFCISSGIIMSKMPETLGKELINEIPELEGIGALIDSTMNKLRSSKRYLISEKLFKASFIGHDPISLSQIGSKSISQIANIGSGIFSRK